MAQLMIPEVLTGALGNETVQALYDFLRDAILTAPKLVEKIKVEITEAKKEIIQEAAAKATEAAGSGIGAAISQQLTAMLADPAQFRQLVTAIANDSKSCDALQRALYRAELSAKDEAKNRRIENIAQATLDTYRERGKGELTIKEITQLVYRIENEGVVRGKQARFYPNVISEWLTDQEAKMTETVAGVVQTRTAKTVIEGYGRLLVLEGLTPDPTAILTRLGKEDIKLKK